MLLTINSSGGCEAGEHVHIANLPRILRSCPRFFSNDPFYGQNRGIEQPQLPLTDECGFSAYAAVSERPGPLLFSEPLCVTAPSPCRIFCPEQWEIFLKRPAGESLSW